MRHAAGTAQTPRAGSIGKVAWASLIGTTIEWYDFVIYSQATALVFAPLFFPSSDPAMGTLAGFATFAVGFAARPFGAIVFGHYGDRVGRKATLVTTLVMMGLSTLAVGLLPTYAQIGIWAPIALVALRLIQGFAVGGEWGGAVLMVVEHAPRHRRGFYGSWPQLGIPLSLIIATSVLTLLSASMRDATFLSWGWRIPFVASAALLMVGLFIRLKISESPEFARLQREGRALRAPVMDVLRTAKLHTLLVVGAQTAVNVSYYVVIVFALNYATSVVGLTRETTLLALIVAAFADLVAIPLFALLSDRIGRKPVMIGGCLFVALFSYPFFALVQSGDGLLLTVAVTAGLAFGHAPIYATMSTFFAEGYGVRSRYSGLSIAYHFGSAISSGPAPLVASALAVAYGGILPVVGLMTASALVSILCLAFLGETRGRDVSAEGTADLAASAGLKNAFPADEKAAYADLIVETGE